MVSNLLILSLLCGINLVYSFIVGPAKLNYDSAQAYCRSLGSNLASITSASQQIDAQTTCCTKARVVGEGCWFGLNDRSGEGQFRYIDNTPFGAGSYTNWQPGEPNNVGNEDCVEVSVGFHGKWNDYQCGVALYPLCNDDKFICPNGQSVQKGRPCSDGFVYLGDHISGNGKIKTNQGLMSKDREYTAVMQTDGNFVIYQWKNNQKIKAIWATSWKGVHGSTEGRYMIYQTDNNFCMYSNSNSFRWCTMKYQPGVPTGRLIMQTDSNLVVYNGYNHFLWGSYQDGGIWGGFAIPFNMMNISGAVIIILIIINFACFIYYSCYTKKRKNHLYGKVASIESDSEC